MVDGWYNNNNNKIIIIIINNNNNDNIASIRKLPIMGTKNSLLDKIYTNHHSSILSG